MCLCSSTVYGNDAPNCRDVAKTKVNRISNAAHEASKTADGARAIWAQHCHRFHTHSPSLAAARPPPYQPRAPAPSSGLPPSTPTSRSRRRPPSTPTVPQSPGVANPSTPTMPRRFYRVSGSPRVLVDRQVFYRMIKFHFVLTCCRRRDAEAELLSAAGSTLLVGNSLEDVEDDDEVTLVGGARFYRVFGSSRVHTSR
jgi:hypothetical protein